MREQTHTHTHTRTPYTDTHTCDPSEMSTGIVSPVTFRGPDLCFCSRNDGRYAVTTHVSVQFYVRLVLTSANERIFLLFSVQVLFEEFSDLKHRKWEVCVPSYIYA